MPLATGMPDSSCTSATPAPIRWRRSRSGRCRRGSPRRARPARRSRRDCASHCSASGISSAPGTLTTTMSSSATPGFAAARARAGEQRLADLLVEARQHDADAQAVAAHVGFDARRHVDAGRWRVRAGSRDRGDHDACAARRLARSPSTSRPKPAMLGILRGCAMQPHLADAQVAQDLRADAVVRRSMLGAPAAASAIARRAQLLARSRGQCSSTITPRPARRSPPARRPCPTNACRCATSSRSSTDSGSCTRTSVSVSGAIVAPHQREMRRIRQSCRGRRPAGTRRAPSSSRSATRSTSDSLRLR